MTTPNPSGLTRRQPALFLGHGSPMNVIEDNAYRRAWQALGERWVGDFGQPKLILCISAHWLTHGWWLTAMAQPRTIHDFGGFPPELYAQQYPAPGAPEWAARIARDMADAGVGLDASDWGLDHGSWGVLKPMFPRADIPVLQLSLNFDVPPAAHYAMGQALRGLREQGVLVVGSGNIVHNLRAFRRGADEAPPYDWALAFDAHVTRLIEAGELAALGDFQSLGAVAREAHPTYEHFLPLLHVAGAVVPGERPSFFNTGMQAASISMRSVIWQ